MVRKKEERGSIFYAMLAKGTGYQSCRRTKSSLSEQGICVLQSRRLPSRLLKVVGKQSLRCSLLAMSMRHSPETLEDVLLLQGEVVQ